LSEMNEDDSCIIYHTNFGVTLRLNHFDIRFYDFIQRKANGVHSITIIYILYLICVKDITCHYNFDIVLVHIHNMRNIYIRVYIFIYILALKYQVVLYYEIPRYTYVYTNQIKCIIISLMIKLDIL
jgi:hypothetical protein